MTTSNRIRVDKRHRLRAGHGTVAMQQPGQAKVGRAFHSRLPPPPLTSRSQTQWRSVAPVGSVLAVQSADLQRLSPETASTA